MILDLASHYFRNCLYLLKLLTFSTRTGSLSSYESRACGTGQWFAAVRGEAETTLEEGNIREGGVGPRERKN
jgi:hypothetical protein